MSVIVLGIITGLGYGLLSTGMVIVYRSNRIINFAHGETGALAAALFALAVIRFGVPYYLAFPVALAVGASVGAGAEVAVIRRLRNAPRLMSVVATLGLGQLLFAITLQATSATKQGLFFPSPPGFPRFDVGTLIVVPAASAMLFLSPVVVGGLALFLRRSRFGLALRGAAANPEAARMAGVYASRMSTLAWAIGGALSTFTAILVAPTIPGGLLAGSAFGPTLLMRGLAGAIIARMTNIPVALGAGVGLGVIEGVLLRNYRSGGTTEVTLFVIILVALLMQARERTREEDKGTAWAAVQAWRPVPERLKEVFLVRHLGWILGAVSLTTMLVVPMFVSNVTATTLTGLLGSVMIALSVGIVTGLGGQLTLGQFALAGVGATVSYHLVGRFGGNPIILLFAGLAAAAATVVIGLPALRIKGLFLAVTTLSFAVAMSAWALKQPWALSGEEVLITPLRIAGHNLDTGRSYYYFTLGVFVVLFLIARNVRMTGFGKLLLAVRDNEDAARSFALRVRKIKLQAFILAGFIAGVGGATYAHSFASFGPGHFIAQYSIDAVVYTVVGGIGILAGPLLGVALVQGVPAFVPVRSLALVASRFGLLLLILYFPGGLVQLIAPMRDRLLFWLGRMFGVAAESDDDEQRDVALEAVAKKSKPKRSAPPDGVIILEAAGLTKRYGGLVAVDDVSLSVTQHETLGLIGPNGAGKTTLFEMLAGFVKPNAGHVRYDGRDVTTWSPEGRAEFGLIRSFQDVQLFPTLSVLDTVQLSLERRVRTRFTESVIGMRGRDRQREAGARDIVGSMGLWSFRNKPIQELSTGTRRITELACIVALRPKLLLLDEPSSGIAQRETEALGQLLLDLKAEHSMTLLIIEHDIPMIMSLADRVIAMDAGRVIAEGRPEVVRHDPAVIEAYLGGKIEAIERSGATARKAAAKRKPVRSKP
jgi:ABC-type branched-subunit amino acid transport system ATPase component/ABC-type branched-subunit amino acid transport system permease subunit